MWVQLNGAEYFAYTANHAPVAGRDSIVLVHGTAMEHSVWSHQSRYFGHHGYNVAALDLPRHGLSGGELLADIEGMAAWVNEMTARLVGGDGGGGDGVHLVGHSMGALIALEAAARMTALRSLTLVGFSYPMTVAPPLLAAARDDPPAAYSMMTQWSHASTIGGEPTPGIWSPGMQMSMMHNSKPGAVLADLTACHAYQGGETALAALRCPTLFLCGRHDRMAPAKIAQAHAQRTAAAEITLLPRCGHNLMSESPDGVLHELQRFIGNHATP